MEDFNIDDIKFYDNESEASSDSESEYGGGLPFNWVDTVRNVTPNLHRVVISIPRELTPEGFVRGIEQSVEHYRYQYGSEWRLSGLVFNVASINPSAFYYKDQVVQRSVRISDDLLDSHDVYNILAHHIRENTASAFVRGGSEEISDDIIGTYVEWNLKTVKLWFEKVSRNDVEMTIVVGETEMHPGVFVKKIHEKDHGKVEYGANDCLFFCLNEATGKRLEPIDVRQEIWPGKSTFKCMSKKISSIGPILKVCQKYDVRLVIYNVETKSFVGVNQSGTQIVKVAKLGSAIGLLDRIVEQTSVEKRTTKYAFAYFDLETVQSGDDDFQRIYSYSFKSDAMTETVCHHDVDLVESTFVDFIKKYLKETPNLTTYLFAWNGARFDAKIIIPLLRKNGCYIAHIINNGANELLSASIKNGDNSGTIILRDPCKLFPDTLNGAAKTLKIGTIKGEIDHNEMEVKYVLGGDEWKKYVVDKRDAVTEYVRNDVHVLEKVVDAIKQLYNISINGKTVPFATCFSRSMAAGHLWSKLHNAETREMIGMFPCGPYTKVCIGDGKIQLIDLMTHVLAARVQTPYGKFHHEDVILVDAKSMYPSRAVLDWYPCGAMCPTKKFVEGKLGLYEVSIFEQNHPHVIPYRRNKNDAYDWRSECSFTKWVTSVDVEELMENGADFRVEQGVYWDGKTNEYFHSYMTTLYELRKVENDIALNLHYKILMNALLGSLLQEMLREYSVILTATGLQDMLKKYGNVISVVDVHEYQEGHMLCVFTPIRLSGVDKNLVRLQEEVCKGAIVHKPGILTWFVLAYARRDLRRVWRLVENVEQGCRMIYCDTDSLMFTNSSYAKRRLEGLGLLGKELGQWDVEYENAEAYIVRAKFYAVRNKNGEEKVRVKGVKRNAYCRTVDDESSLRADDLARISEMEEYDERSVLFKEIVEHAKDKPLGPSFEHVRDVYKGAKLQVVNFQMHKSNGGIMKKYIVSEF